MDFMTSSFCLRHRRGLHRLIRQIQVAHGLDIPRSVRVGRNLTLFTGTLATTPQPLKPHLPESKGLVERSSGYFETSFMPGRAITSPADFKHPVR